MQIKNRRENIFIDKPPVEIPSIDDIETALDSDGYVKAEDLPIATDEVAGMVKIGEGVTVTADGTISVSGGGGGGVNADVLYQLSGAGPGEWVDNIDLPVDYTDYKLIFFNYGSGSHTGGNCLYPPSFGLNEIGFMRAGSNYDIQIKFTALKKMSVQVSGAISGAVVVGIR